MKKSILKSTAAVLTLLFLANSVVQAAPGIDFATIVKSEIPRISHIDIPPELATLDDWFESPRANDSRLMLQIQDAHAQPEAQARIRDLIHYLHDKYQFKTIFVEGASEALDPKLLKPFSDEASNVKWAEKKAASGEMSGVDLALLDGVADLKTLPIETIEGYRNGYQKLRSVYSSEQNVKSYFEFLDSKLDLTASKILDEKTRAILSEWKKFESGHREFLPFVERLAGLAKSDLKVDMAAVYSQIEWPQLTRLLALQRIEKELAASHGPRASSLETKANDLLSAERVTVTEQRRDKGQSVSVKQQAEVEKQQLASQLKVRGVSDALLQGLERLDEKHLNLNRITLGDGKQFSTPRMFVEKLVDETRRLGIDLKKYPAFLKYAGYIILRGEIQPSVLFKEIEILFNKLLDATDGAKASVQSTKLIELYRNSFLLKKLLNLELSREEWLRAVERRSDLEPMNVLRRLKLFGATSHEPRVTKESQSSDGEKLMDFSEGSHQGVIRGALTVERAFSDAFGFYDAAIARENIFFDKISASLRQNDKAILITGGFHTAGLKDFFRDKEISYGSLTPRLMKIESSSLYRNAMMSDTDAGTSLQAPIPMAHPVKAASEMRLITPDSAPRTRRQRLASSSNQRYPLTGEHHVVKNWEEITPSLLQAARRGQLKVLFVDMDNTTFSTRGFHGSEAQLQQVAKRVRDLGGASLLPEMFGYFDRTHAWMIKNGYFEPASKLHPELFRKLQSAGVKLVAVTARPPKIRVNTVAAYDAAVPGVKLDEWIFTNGGGKKKLRAIADKMRSFGVTKEQAYLIDDRRDNVVSVDAVAGTILINDAYIDERNLDASHYLSRIDSTAKNEWLRLEYALNALIATQKEVQRARMREVIRTKLTDAMNAALDEAVAEIDSFNARFGTTWDDFRSPEVSRSEMRSFDAGQPETDLVSRQPLARSETREQQAFDTVLNAVLLAAHHDGLSALHRQNMRDFMHMMSRKHQEEFLDELKHQAAGNSPRKTLKPILSHENPDFDAVVSAIAEAYAQWSAMSDEEKATTIVMPLLYGDIPMSSAWISPILNKIFSRVGVDSSNEYHGMLTLRGKAVPSGVEATDSASSVLELLQSAINHDQDALISPVKSVQVTLTDFNDSIAPDDLAGILKGIVKIRDHHTRNVSESWMQTFAIQVERGIAVHMNVSADKKEHHLAEIDHKEQLIFKNGSASTLAMIDAVGENKILQDPASIAMLMSEKVNASKGFEDIRSNLRAALSKSQVPLPLQLLMMLAIMVDTDNFKNEDTVKPVDVIAFEVLQESLREVIRPQTAAFEAYSNMILSFLSTRVLNNGFKSVAEMPDQAARDIVNRDILVEKILNGDRKPFASEDGTKFLFSSLDLSSVKDIPGYNATVLPQALREVRHRLKDAAGNSEYDFVVVRLAFWGDQEVYFKVINLSKKVTTDDLIELLRVKTTHNATPGEISDSPHGFSVHPKGWMQRKQLSGVILKYLNARSELRVAIDSTLEQQIEWTKNVDRDVLNQRIIDAATGLGWKYKAKPEPVIHIKFAGAASIPPSVEVSDSAIIFTTNKTKSGAIADQFLTTLRNFKKQKGKESLFNVETVAAVRVSAAVSPMRRLMNWGLIGFGVSLVFGGWWFLSRGKSPNPLTKDYSRDLNGAVQLLGDTIDWLIDNHYPYPEVLRSYRNDLKSAVILPAERSGNGASLADKSTLPDGSVQVSLNVNALLQIFSDAKRTNSTDYLVEMLGMFLAREAWGAWINKIRTPEEKLRDANNIRSLVRSYEVEGGGKIGAPGDAQQRAFLLAHQSQIESIAAHSISNEFYEMLSQRAFMDWAVAEKIYVSTRRDETLRRAGAINVMPVAAFRWPSQPKDLFAFALKEFGMLALWTVLFQKSGYSQADIAVVLFMESESLRSVKSWNSIIENAPTLGTRLDYSAFQPLADRLYPLVVERKPSNFPFLNSARSEMREITADVSSSPALAKDLLDALATNDDAQILSTLRKIPSGAGLKSVEPVYLRIVAKDRADLGRLMQLGFAPEDSNYFENLLSGMKTATYKLGSKISVEFTDASRSRMEFVAANPPQHTKNSRYADLTELLGAIDYSKGWDVSQPISFVFTAAFSKPYSKLVTVTEKVASDAVAKEIADKKSAVKKLIDDLTKAIADSGEWAVNVVALPKVDGIDYAIDSEIAVLRAADAAINKALESAGQLWRDGRQKLLKDRSASIDEWNRSLKRIDTDSKAANLAFDSTDLRSKIQGKQQQLDLLKKQNDAINKLIQDLTKKSQDVKAAIKVVEEKLEQKRAQDEQQAGEEAAQRKVRFRNFGWYLALSFLAVVGAFVLHHFLFQFVSQRNSSELAARQRDAHFAALPTPYQDLVRFKREYSYTASIKKNNELDRINEDRQFQVVSFTAPVEIANVLKSLGQSPMVAFWWKSQDENTSGLKAPGPSSIATPVVRLGSKAPYRDFFYYDLVNQLPHVEALVSSQPLPQPLKASLFRLMLEYLLDEKDWSQEQFGKRWKEMIPFAKPMNHVQVIPDNTIPDAKGYVPLDQPGYRYHLIRFNFRPDQRGKEFTLSFLDRNGSTAYTISNFSGSKLVVPNGRGSYFQEVSPWYGAFHFQYAPDSKVATWLPESIEYIRDSVESSADTLKEFKFFLSQSVAEAEGLINYPKSEIATFSVNNPPVEAHDLHLQGVDVFPVDVTYSLKGGTAETKVQFLVVNIKLPSGKILMFKKNAVEQLGNFILKRAGVQIIANPFIVGIEAVQEMGEHADELTEESVREYILRVGNKLGVPARRSEARASAITPAILFSALSAVGSYYFIGAAVALLPKLIISGLVFAVIYPAFRMAWRVTFSKWNVPEKDLLRPMIREWKLLGHLIYKSGPKVKSFVSELYPAFWRTILYSRAMSRDQIRTRLRDLRELGALPDFFDARIFAINVDLRNDWNRSGIFAGAKNIIADGERIYVQRIKAGFLPRYDFLVIDQDNQKLLSHMEFLDQYPELEEIFPDERIYLNDDDTDAMEFEDDDPDDGDEEGIGSVDDDLRLRVSRVVDRTVFNETRRLERAGLFLFGSFFAALTISLFREIPQQAYEKVLSHMPDFIQNAAGFFPHSVVPVYMATATFVFVSWFLFLRLFSLIATNIIHNIYAKLFEIIKLNYRLAIFTYQQFSILWSRSTSDLSDDDRDFIFYRSEWLSLTRGINDQHLPVPEAEKLRWKRLVLETLYKIPADVRGQNILMLGFDAQLFRVLRKMGTKHILISMSNHAEARAAYQHGALKGATEMLAPESERGDYYFYDHSGDSDADAQDGLRRFAATIKPSLVIGLPGTVYAQWKSNDFSAEDIPFVPYARNAALLSNEGFWKKVASVDDNNLRLLELYEADETPIISTNAPGLRMVITARSEMRRRAAAKTIFAGAAAFWAGLTSSSKAEEPLIRWTPGTVLDLSSHPWKFRVGDYASTDSAQMTYQGQSLSEVTVTYAASDTHYPQMMTINANGAIRITPVKEGRNFVFGSTVYLGRWTEDDGSQYGVLHDGARIKKIVSAYQNPDTRVMEIILELEDRDPKGNPAWNSKTAKLSVYPPDAITGAVRMDIDYQIQPLREFKVRRDNVKLGEGWLPVFVASNNVEAAFPYHDADMFKLFDASGRLVRDQDLNSFGATVPIAGFRHLTADKSWRPDLIPAAGLGLINETVSRDHQADGQKEPPSILIIPHSGNFTGTGVMTYRRGETTRANDNLNALFQPVWDTAPPTRYQGSVIFLPPGRVTESDFKGYLNAVRKQRSESRVDDVSRRRFLGTGTAFVGWLMTNPIAKAMQAAEQAVIPKTKVDLAIDKAISLKPADMVALALEKEKELRSQNWGAEQARPLIEKLVSKIFPEGTSDDRENLVRMGLLILSIESMNYRELVQRYEHREKLTKAQIKKGEKAKWLREPVDLAYGLAQIEVGSGAKASSRVAQDHLKNYLRFKDIDDQASQVGEQIRRRIRDALAEKMEVEPLDFSRLLDAAKNRAINLYGKKGLTVNQVYDVLGPWFAKRIIEDRETDILLMLTQVFRRISVKDGSLEAIRANIPDLINGTPEERQARATEFYGNNYRSKISDQNAVRTELAWNNSDDVIHRGAEAPVPSAIPVPEPVVATVAPVEAPVAIASVEPTQLPIETKLSGLEYWFATLGFASTLTMGGRSIYLYLQQNYARHIQIWLPSLLRTWSLALVLLADLYAFVGYFSGRNPGTIKLAVLGTFTGVIFVSYVATWLVSGRDFKKAFNRLMRMSLVAQETTRLGDESTSRTNRSEDRVFNRDETLRLVKGVAHFLTQGTVYTIMAETNFEQIIRGARNFERLDPINQVGPNAAFLDSTLSNDQRQIIFGGVANIETFDYDSSYISDRLKLLIKEARKKLVVQFKLQDPKQARLLVYGGLSARRVGLAVVRDWLGDGEREAHLKTIYRLKVVVASPQDKSIEELADGELSDYARRAIGEIKLIQSMQAEKFKGEVELVPADVLSDVTKLESILPESNEARSEMRTALGDFLKTLYPAGVAQYRSADDVPHAAVLMGNPDSQTFIEFAHRWMNDPLLQKSKIIIAGGIGRGTLPLLESAARYYQESNPQLTSLLMRWYERISNHPVDKLFDLSGEINEALIVNEILKAEGVPADKIQMEGRSRTTKENFENISRLLQEIQAKQGLSELKIQLVTAPWLLRRAHITAENIWQKKDWKITSPAIYEPDTSLWDDDRVMSVAGYALGYPESLKAQHADLSTNSEMKGVGDQTAAGANVRMNELPAGYAKHDGDDAALVAARSVFEEWLQGGAKLFQFDPVESRMRFPVPVLKMRVSQIDATQHMQYAAFASDMDVRKVLVHSALVSGDERTRTQETVNYVRFAELKPLFGGQSIKYALKDVKTDETRYTMNMWSVKQEGHLMPMHVLQFIFNGKTIGYGFFNSVPRAKNTPKQVHLRFQLFNEFRGRGHAAILMTLFDHVFSSLEFKQIIMITDQGRASESTPEFRAPFIRLGFRWDKKLQMLIYDIKTKRSEMRVLIVESGLRDKFQNVKPGMIVDRATNEAEAMKKLMAQNDYDIIIFSQFGVRNLDAFLNQASVMNPEAGVLEVSDAGSSGRIEDLQDQYPMMNLRVLTEQMASGNNLDFIVNQVAMPGGMNAERFTEFFESLQGWQQSGPLGRSLTFGSAWTLISYSPDGSWSISMTGNPNEDRNIVLSWGLKSGSRDYQLTINHQGRTIKLPGWTKRNPLIDLQWNRDSYQLVFRFAKGVEDQIRTLDENFEFEAQPVSRGTQLFAWKFDFVSHNSLRSEMRLTALDPAVEQFVTRMREFFQELRFAEDPIAFFESNFPWAQNEQPFGGLPELSAFRQFQSSLRDSVGLFDRDDDSHALFAHRWEFSDWVHYLFLYGHETILTRDLRKYLSKTDEFETYVEGFLLLHNYLVAMRFPNKVEKDEKRFWLSVRSRMNPSPKSLDNLFNLISDVVIRLEDHNYPPEEFLDQLRAWKAQAEVVMGRSEIREELKLENAQKFVSETYGLDTQDVAVLGGGFMGKRLGYKQFLFHGRDGKKWVLKFYGFSKSKAEKIAEFVARLRAKGLPVPELKKLSHDTDPNNHFLAEALISDGRFGFYGLESFLEEGQELALKAMLPAHFEELGKIAARMQNALSGWAPEEAAYKSRRDIYATEIEPKISDLERQIDILISSHSENEVVAYLKRHREEVVKLIKRQAQLFRDNYPTTSLPRGVIHNDLIPSNLQWRDGKIVGFFDFNLAQADDRAVEFNNFIFGGDGTTFPRFKIENLDAAIQGYDEVADQKLSDDEKKAVREVLRLRLLQEIIYPLFSRDKVQPLTSRPVDFWFSALESLQSLDHEFAKAPRSEMRNEDPVVVSASQRPAPSEPRSVLGGVDVSIEAAYREMIAKIDQLSPELATDVIAEFFVNPSLNAVSVSAVLLDLMKHLGWDKTIKLAQDLRDRFPVIAAKFQTKALVLEEITSAELHDKTFFDQTVDAVVLALTLNPQMSFSFVTVDGSANDSVLYSDLTAAVERRVKGGGVREHVAGFVGSANMIKTKVIKNVLRGNLPTAVSLSQDLLDAVRYEERIKRVNRTYQRNNRRLGLTTQGLLAMDVSGQIADFFKEGIEYRVSDERLQKFDLRNELSRMLEVVRAVSSAA